HADPGASPGSVRHAPPAQTARARLGAPTAPTFRRRRGRVSQEAAEAVRKGRPQRDSNPRRCLERAMSWAWLDDGDRRPAPIATAPGSCNGLAGKRGGRERTLGKATEDVLLATVPLLERPDQLAQAQRTSARKVLAGEPR